MVSPQKDFRIQRVVQDLNEDPFRTVPALARNCQISVSRLSHLFKDETGLNVRNYRLDRRLETAAGMLMLTGMSVKEVAYSAAYHHCSSFTRAFKTHFGVSPGSYRERQLRKAGVAACANK
jgi:AraC-like DNA-binding protein